MRRKPPSKKEKTLGAKGATQKRKKLDAGPRETPTTQGPHSQVRVSNGDDGRNYRKKSFGGGKENSQERKLGGTCGEGV